MNKKKLQFKLKSWNTSGTITRPKVRPNKIMLMPYIHLKKMKYEATEEPK